MNRISLFTLVGLSWMLYACSGQSKKETATPVDSNAVAAPAPLNLAPEWASNATMYEVNVRQYSKKGTLAEFNQSIPRLRNMGVDILWFMPIQPIGVLNRKGGLGSYYSISDYVAVNPEFGSLQDFKESVRQAHSVGMKVILDWVGNHSAFDHKWALEHPEWYTRDSAGNILPPNPDWSDVADLNYDNQDMRTAMIEAMKFWVREADIDGFRCDVAGEVPLDFWEDAIRELRGMKEVFMLAEWDSPEMHSCFNATYAWTFHHELMEIGKGHHNLDSLRGYLLEEQTRYEKGAYKLRFTTNHDENTWKGTEKDLFGPDVRSFQAMLFALPSMPLLYSGQESGLNQRLEFFEKDLIVWNKYESSSFFQQLDKVRDEHQALWGGEDGGSLEFLGEDCSNGILAFDRVKGEQRIRYIHNGNDQPIDISFYLTGGQLTDLMNEAPFTSTSLKGHDFVLLEVNP